MGCLARFDYSGVGDPLLGPHDRQDVMVLYRLIENVDPEVGPMFRIRFNDGAEHDAFRDELTCLHADGEDASDCIVGLSDICRESFMAGAECVLPTGHSGSHASGE